MSVKKASELTHYMYQIIYRLPDSRHTKSKILKMDEKQEGLSEIINKNFQGVPMRKTGNNKVLGIISFLKYGFYNAMKIYGELTYYIHLIE